MASMLTPWFLLVLVTATAERLVSEEIMRTILESCYQSDNSSNPTLISGDFSKFSDEVSIIRINGSLSLEYYGKFQPLRFKASNVILIENSPEKLASDLQLLKETQLWDHMIPFFIVGQNTLSCDSSRNILATMWRIQILNSVYICANLINNTVALYTLNPITNYAPYPWKSIEQSNDLNIYRQKFDSEISCLHLTYDKTKILNGYKVTGKIINISALTKGIFITIT